MSSQSDSQGNARLSRPRANTSLAFPWRRNRADAIPASTSLTSSPAAPVQTLPIDTLIDHLTPPAVPSLSHARALVTALTTQTPPPSPAVLYPIVSGLCVADTPSSLQAVGFEILTTYCSCGIGIQTSDRLMFFDLLKNNSGNTGDGIWLSDVWEPRLRALNALMQNDDDTLGVDKTILTILSSWLEGALGDLLESQAISSERQEKERAVEEISDALAHWFCKLESTGRLSEVDSQSLFDFYRKLVEDVIILPLDTQPPAPVLPFRENDAIRSTPIRHRRNQSSTSLIASPLSSQQSPHSQNPDPIRSLHLVVVTIYLSFLEKQMNVLRPIYLWTLIPLLFRILATLMSPLRLISPYAPPAVEQKTSDVGVVKMILALLNGPFSTHCTFLLKNSLLPNESYSKDSDHYLETLTKTSLGALRMLRLQIRYELENRMAERCLQREASLSATHTGAPSAVPDQHLVERAQRVWHHVTIWDARKISFLLVRSINAWTKFNIHSPFLNVYKERIFEEVAGLIEDVAVELLDSRSDSDNYGVRKDEFANRDNDIPCAIGETLHELMNYVKTLRNDDGSFVIIPRTGTLSASPRIIHLLVTILGRIKDIQDLEPPLPIIKLSATDHFLDADTEEIPLKMLEQQRLSPSEPNWLENWRMLLNTESLFVSTRPLTRRAVISSMQKTFSFIIDMPVYRRQFMDIVFDFWMRHVKSVDESIDEVAVWKLLGEEIVLRSTEDDIPDLFTPTDTMNSSEQLTIHTIMITMISVSGYCDCLEDDGSQGQIEAAPLSPMAPATPQNAPSSAQSPVPVQKVYPESPGIVKDKDTGNMQQVMSLFTLGGSRHQSQSHVHQIAIQDDPFMSDRFENSPVPAATAEFCRGATAIVAFIEVFIQLAFVDDKMTKRQADLAVYAFGQLLKLLRTARCSKVRLSILRALMRLRADRDHRIYFKADPTDHEPQISRLADLLGRVKDSSKSASQNGDAQLEDTVIDRARARQPFQRDGRKTSRGRASQTSGTLSRSQSRVTGRGRGTQGAFVISKARGPLWLIPDTVPFSVEHLGKDSQLLVTYNPLKSETAGIEAVVLPVSDYMDVLVEIFKTERDWDILSYVLVHLPAQLANKHFWCGPKMKLALVNLLAELSKGIREETIGKYIPQEDWLLSLKPRDAQGIAFHTLTTLISYASVFDTDGRRGLVDIFLDGLSRGGDTIIVCLHALCLCAFEMETQIVKALPRILEKLSQIMSSAAMVHILTFLVFIASLPHLYTNFTGGDYKTVFGVALQCLQHHNRPETQQEIQFSLSQHVRVMSYYVIYIWFLALKLADRPQHIKFIIRQLLLANEGREDVDDSTEVCFDWLARYTYASADPKPAPSFLHDVLSNPVGSMTTSEVVQSRSWILGYSIVTVKLLAKPGWFEVTTRRASGMTRFLCRNENVPLVDLGDVNPDMVTIPASLMMDKDLRLMQTLPPKLNNPPNATESAISGTSNTLSTSEDLESDVARPDPITGYVWSGSAPSQRRKHVDVDPSFFPLQLSPYPDIRGGSQRGLLIQNTRELDRDIRTLDRTPVIDTHKIGILYVAPGQTEEVDILGNSHGSPAYTRFLEGIGRLIKIKGQRDVYTGGLVPDEDGEYAYAWWDDIGQLLYHTATLMPNHADSVNNKKRHIGNDLVRIVWNDSGHPYRFDTIATEFQFVNIVIEPHSHGTIAAYSNNLHENEYFRLSIHRVEGMMEFTPIGDFKIVSASSLPQLVRQLSLVADWYACIFKDTKTEERNEFVTNWRERLRIIKNLAESVRKSHVETTNEAGILSQQKLRDFTPGF